jgi:Tfp pilus tip-associated adhesin PilY1
MKKHTSAYLSVFLLWSGMLFGNVSGVRAETAADYTSIPPFITAGAPPLVMLVMGRDHKLYYEAYNDASDLNEDGVLDIRYNPAIDYYGYFDNHKCYTYDSGDKRFEPSSVSTDKKCTSAASDWSGDFLNYLTMSRMDTMRKVLYGGYRSTDTAGETVLERVSIPQDAHSWGKEYTSITVDGYDIADYAPFSVPALGTRHLFASTTRTSATSPPLFAYHLNQTDRIWKWVTTEAPLVKPRTGEVVQEVRVKVCDSTIGLEANCQQYPDGNYKPVGLLQRHGESLYDTATSSYKTPKMYFGLMTGSYAKSTSGGVLRKKMGNISDEIETNTNGTFKSSTNGIIQTINKMRIYGYSYAATNYNLNCGWIVSGPMTEGQCRDWGNPIGEIMYEAERYFAGKKAPSAIFDYSGTTDDSNLGLPKDTWNDPYDKATGGFDYCAKPFMLVLSDINPSYDSNQLPGVDTNFGAGITSDLTGLDVGTTAATISTTEGIGGGKFIGQSGSTVDGVCTEKTVTGLGSIRGLCPEEPTKLGSYYSASVANYGHITDLNSATGNQKITTYGIGLASPLPRIEFKIGLSEKLITLVPFGKSVGGYGITSAFYPTNTIVDFYVEQLTPTYGKFNINYEDVEQGADHDMDAIVEYQYQLVDGSNNNVSDPHSAVKVKITLTSTAASGSIIQHLGYIISGTTADGQYLEVRDSDTLPASADVHTLFDTGGTPLPLTATREFFPSATGGAAAQLLPNPLWYAAKWGAYEEKDITPGPNLQEEWDADHDGIPDTYFYVSNPLKLEEQLNKSFADMLRKTRSGTAASVISGSRSGEGAVYQSVFYPEFTDTTTAHNAVNWVGSVHASFVDDLGRMREDTNKNRILDVTDKVIVFRKVASSLYIDLYEIDGAVAEESHVTLPAASALSVSTGIPCRYMRLNSVGEEYYVWFIVNGVGTDPQPHNVVPHDITGISIALDATDDAHTVAIKTATALNNAYSAFTVLTPAADTITVTNTIPGDVTDATAGTSGVTITIAPQGSGESSHFDSLGDAENLKYLWNSSSWLNSITDADIVKQREYSSTAKKRYIFTFIDADQDKVADEDAVAGLKEQLPFVAESLPRVDDLKDPAKIFPYIPINSDSEALPPYVISGGTQEEFLKKQTQRVVNYIRGLDQESATLTSGTGGTIPAFRSRKVDKNNDSIMETWRLGDIVYSSPTLVSKPQEALHLLYKDTSYATFAAKYQKRRAVLYVGANDGMLHAFNAGFFEDRFDVYPVARDNVKDVEYLLQPKNSLGVSDTSVSAHALGSELWAYIPYNLLPHLYWLTEPDYNDKKHVYYADLKPRIFDAKIFTPDTDHPGGWGTVLVGGMRFGGGKINIDMDRTDGTVNANDRSMSSAYYILDITNPEAPPVVLGELTFPHLGYTTCYPTVAAMKDKTDANQNDWYLIFGSGPAEADGTPGTLAGSSLDDAVSNQSAKLYVVDLVSLVKDKALKTIDSTGHTTTVGPDYYAQNFTNDKNAFISDPITVDYDLDYKADAVYFGTVSYDSTAKWGGKLRRIVINDDVQPLNWGRDSVLMDLETVQHQPISAAPTVGVDADGNNWVFFGTGRYVIRNDKDITSQQTFYGIKEPRSLVSPFANTYDEVFLSNLYNSTSIAVNATTKMVSGGPVPPSGTVGTPKSWSEFVAATKVKDGLGRYVFQGWYYNFDFDVATATFERNVGQAALFGDLLTFTSYVPSSDTCEYEGSSYLYALNYLTGTASVNTVIHDSANPNPVNNIIRIPLGKGLVSKPSIHVGAKDGSTVFVQTSDGAILTLGEENPGQTKSGTTSWGYR